MPRAAEIAEKAFLACRLKQATSEKELIVSFTLGALQASILTWTRTCILQRRITINNLIGGKLIGGKILMMKFMLRAISLLFA